jgi:hypothetical protein
MSSMTAKRSQFKLLSGQWRRLKKLAAQKIARGDRNDDGGVEFDLAMATMSELKSLCNHFYPLPEYNRAGYREVEYKTVARSPQGKVAVVHSTCWSKMRDDGWKEVGHVTVPFVALASQRVFKRWAEQDSQS